MYWFFHIYGIFSKVVIMRTLLTGNVRLMTGLRLQHRSLHIFYDFVVQDYSYYGQREAFSGSGGISIGQIVEVNFALNSNYCISL